MELYLILSSKLYIKDISSECLRTSFIVNPSITKGLETSKVESLLNTLFSIPEAKYYVCNTVPGS